MYPALAVLDALHGKVDPMLWVGSETGMEADLIARTGLSFKAIPAAGIHGVGLRSLPGNLYQLARGYTAARKILRDFNPDVLFFTGGYVAVPMALAAREYSSVLYVPDIEPGLALKTLARYCQSYRRYKRIYPPLPENECTCHRHRVPHPTGADRHG